MKENYERYACGEADAERFARIAREVTAAAKGEYSGGDAGVGVLNEKRMHAAIKKFICADGSFHEQRPLTGGRGTKKYVADVLAGGEIYEIQTGSFWPLRKKLEWYAANTGYHVTVVHPVAVRRRIVWIDPESGEATPSPRRAPARRAADVLPELVYISELAAEGRVGVELLLIEAEEYRFLDGWARGGKRGSSRFEMLPVALMGRVRLELPEDYADLLAPELYGHEFTAAEFARLMHFRSRPAYLALGALTVLGVARVSAEERPRRYILTGER